MKSLVINLDRATERIAHISRTFDEQRIDFTRIAAIDARQLTADDVTRWCAKGGRLGVTELACFLSHRKCWQEIIDLGLPYAAVFEDDVLLGSEAGTTLIDDDWIPAGADIVKLETNARRTILGKHVAGHVNGRKVKRLIAPHVNSVAYIVSLKAARGLIDGSEQIDRPVDLYLFDEAGLKRRAIYQLVPAPCVQPFVAKRLKIDAGNPALIASEIADDRKARRPQGLRRAAHKLRRLFQSSHAFLRGRIATLSGTREWRAVPFK